VRALATVADQKIARAYDAPPWWYDIRGFFILKLSYRSSLISQIALFGAALGEEHLEAAIGSGSLFDLVLAYRRLFGRPPPRRVATFDLAPAMLAGAERRFRSRPWIEVRRADVASLPWPDASFDTANVANAVHCFPDLDAGLSELARVLRPGGTLTLNALLLPRPGSIADAINRWGMKKGILESPLEEADVLERLERAGFVIARTRRQGNALDVIAVRSAEGGT
jgi:ubiquinone/menaquinone biosynthesis C-methylase UbiE